MQAILQSESNTKPNNHLTRKELEEIVRLIGERLIALNLRWGETRGNNPILSDEDLNEIAECKMPSDLGCWLTDFMYTYEPDSQQDERVHMALRSCWSVIKSLKASEEFVLSREQQLEGKIKALEALGFAEVENEPHHKFMWTSGPTNELVGVDATVVVMRKSEGDPWSYDIYIDGDDNLARGQGCSGCVTPIEGEGAFDDPIDCAEEAFGYLRQSLQSILDELPL